MHRKRQSNYLPPHISIRLISKTGESLGIIKAAEALEAARKDNLDLVEISPNAEPPVYKIMDYGRYKYEQQKKLASAKKNQKVIVVKEIKLRPLIDSHDYQVKKNKMIGFLKDGNKVKVTVRFRGRELAHQSLGSTLMDNIKADIEEVGIIQYLSKLENRQMVMIINPRS